MASAVHPDLTAPAARRFSLRRRSTALPPAAFKRRHRGILLLVLTHLAALPVFAVLNDWSLWEGLAATAPAAALGGLAAVPRLSPTARASLAVLALLCCSAALVWLWRGTIEAHFHYFVVVGVVALYEAVLPYAIAFAFVVLQHGAMSAWFPHRVFAHMADMGHGWSWAAVHGGFIAALALANLVSWRASDELRISELDARDAALRSARRFQEAFAGAPNGAALISEDGTMLAVNAALAASAQTTPGELTGRRWFELLPERARPDALAAWPPDDEGGEDELPLLREDGSEGWLLWKHSQLSSDDGRSQWIAQTVDVSRRRLAEASLAHQAAHDALTGLPNRVEFHRLAQTALEARGPADSAAILFADVDDFKVVNDSLGHAAGDELLVTVVSRLRSALRDDDVIARFGGDEFAVLLPGVDATAAFGAAERLSATLQVPFLLADVERQVTASFGLVIAGPDDTAIGDLLRDADLAMYEAKADGKARCRVFDPEMRRTAVDRLQLEADLRDAVLQDAIGVHYQPQVDIATGRILGLEALARWTHPIRGNVPPGVFIPIAEHSGLVGAIGAHVLRTACVQLARWDAEDPSLASLTMSINASPRCMCNVELPDVVGGILRDTGIAPSRICIEITESAVVRRDERTDGVIAGLKRLGVCLAIDDFGVGESSLSQLARLTAIDELKIDKSFIDDLDEPHADTALVGAIVGVAAAKGRRIVAEGIETPQQHAHLRAIGCPVGQGYLYARPAPAGEIIGILRTEPNNAAVGR